MNQRVFPALICCVTLLAGCAGAAALVIEKIDLFKPGGGGPTSMAPEEPP